MDRTLSSLNEDDEGSMTTLQNIVVLSSTPIIANKELFSVYLEDRQSMEIPLSLHDALALTERMVRWQSENLDRVTLYVMPTISDNIPAIGRFAPRLQSTDKGSRNCKITVLLQTAANDRIQIHDRPRSIQDFEKLCLDEDPSAISDTSFTFEITKRNYEIYPQRCYWDIDIRPKQNLHTSKESFPESHLSAICCGPDYHGSSQHVIFGPLVGAVSQCHAEVLLEFSCFGYIELVASDQITGERFISLQYVVPNIPKIFTFANLRSNHPFDISIVDHNLIPRFSSFIRGSFTTLEFINSSIKAKENQQRSDIISDLHRQIPAVDISAIDLATARTPASQRPISLLSSRMSSRLEANQSKAQSENPTSELPPQVETDHPSVANLPSYRRPAQKPEDKSVRKSAFRLLSHPLSSIKLRSVRIGQETVRKKMDPPSDAIAEENEVLVPKTPSVFIEAPIEEKLPEIQRPRNINIIAIGRQHSSFDLHLAADRDRAIQGDLLVSDLVSNLLTPFNSISEVLHFGSQIDASMIREEVLSYAAQLEEYTSHDQSFSSDDLDIIVRRLKDCLKSCYRLCWQSSTLRKSLLANGSHIFIHDPVLDLFEVFGVTDYSGLKRDLNEETVQFLVRTMKEAFLDLCTFQRETFRCIGNDNALIYHLKPDLLSSGGHLISKEQYHDLREFLLGLQEPLQPNPSLLFLTSPIVFIHPDATEQFTAETSGISINDFYGQLRYSYRDISILSVIEEHWLKQGRNAIILCSGMTNFSMKITPKNPLSHGSLHQVVCGPIGSRNTNSKSSTLELEITLPSSSFTCGVSYASEEPMVSVINANQGDSSPIFTDNISSTLSSQNKGITMPAYASDIWQLIISYLNGIDDEISIDPKREKASVEGLNDDSAWKVLKALDKIINYRHVDLFNQIYHRFQSIELLRQSSPLPSLYAALFNLIYEYRQQTFPKEIADLLPQPSSLTIHILWHLHVRMRQSDQDRLDHVSSLGGDVLLSDDDHMIAISAMRNDCDGFVRYLRHLFGAQILSEYFAAK